MNFYIVSNLKKNIFKHCKFFFFFYRNINVKFSEFYGSKLLGMIGKMIANNCKNVIRNVIDTKAVEIIKEKIIELNEIIKKYDPTTENLIEKLILPLYFIFHR